MDNNIEELEARVSQLKEELKKAQDDLCIAINNKTNEDHIKCKE
jgi:hypothetical protein